MLVSQSEKTNIRQMDVGMRHVRNVGPNELGKAHRRSIGMRASRDAVLVSESGLYKLVMRSDKHTAKLIRAAVACPP